MHGRGKALFEFGNNVFDFGLPRDFFSDVHRLALFLGCDNLSEPRGVRIFECFRLESALEFF